MKKTNKMVITERVQLFFICQSLMFDNLLRFLMFNENSVEIQIAKVVFCIKKYLEAIFEFYMVCVEYN